METTVYQLIIADNEPGIDPNFPEKIFVMFPTRQTANAGGKTGLGLASVKKSQ